MIKQWCKEHITKYSVREIIEICNLYLSTMDGSSLTKTQENEIQKIYNQYPLLMDVICAAFREKGYNEF